MGAVSAQAATVLHAAQWTGPEYGAVHLQLQVASVQTALGNGIWMPNARVILGLLWPNSLTVKSGEDMYPIYRQDMADSIGMGYQQFVKEFIDICEHHKQNGHARAFAFIFYDNRSKTLYDALGSDGGFKTLNDASGKHLTIFYLNAEENEGLSKAFNKRFRKVLNIQDQVHPPCIVFFRIHAGNLEDIDPHPINAEQKPHIVVAQLERAILDYIARLNQQGDFSALPCRLEIVTLAGFFEFFKSLLVSSN